MSAPALRFKDEEGLKFPDWKATLLGKVAAFTKGKGLSKADIVENGATPCIRYGELYTEYGATIHDVKSKTNVDVADLVFSQSNDVIIPASGETQVDIATASCVQLSGIALGGDLNIIRSKLDGVFLSYYLNSQKKLDIAKLAQGNSVVHLYSSQLKQLELNVPSKFEQTKIANFLTAVDENISQLTRKHELLTQYKKGVMQQIFSQELRFKDDDGREFSEWEEFSLADALIPDFREVDKPQGEYLSIGIRSHCKGTFQKPEADPEKNSMDKLFVVHQGDLIVNITFAWEGAIAIVKQEDHGGYVSHRFPTYRFKPEVTFSDFFRFVILQSKFRETLELISPGGAGRNRVMSKKEFLKINIRLPSIAEQTKIANFLTAIDDKVAATQTKIAAVKQYKQGLLQQMFV